MIGLLSPLIRGAALLVDNLTTTFSEVIELDFEVSRVFLAQKGRV